MILCKLCHTPIRRDEGQEGKSDKDACWIHVTGFYQCPKSRSEYDLAEYDPKLVYDESAQVDHTQSLDGGGI
jgi:hypothetical protein